MWDEYGVDAVGENENGDPGLSGYAVWKVSEHNLRLSEEDDMTDSEEERVVWMAVTRRSGGTHCEDGLDHQQPFHYYRV